MADNARVPRLVLRGIAAVLLATQGVVHLWLWRDGYAAIPRVRTRDMKKPPGERGFRAPGRI